MCAFAGEVCCAAWRGRGREPVACLLEHARVLPDAVRRHETPQHAEVLVPLELMRPQRRALPFARRSRHISHRHSRHHRECRLLRRRNGLLPPKLRPLGAELAFPRLELGAEPAFPRLKIGAEPAFPRLPRLKIRLVSIQPVSSCFELCPLLRRACLRLSCERTARRLRGYGAMLLVL